MGGWVGKRKRREAFLLSYKENNFCENLCKHFTCPYQIKEQEVKTYPDSTTLNQIPFSTLSRIKPFTNAHQNTQDWRHTCFQLALWKSIQISLYKFRSFFPGYVMLVDAAEPSLVRPFPHRWVLTLLPFFTMKTNVF